MTMSNLVNKTKKGKSNNTPVSVTTKMPDHKTETTKPGEKIQPTAEQLRMALIIDMKTEDPSLKEKMREVMEATKKSEDEVFTALHDCDNDPNRAVNLLLEGGQSVWSTSQKKKKCRVPGEKKEPAYIPPNGSPPPVLEDWEKELGPNSSTTYFNPPRGRGGRGRPRERDSSETKSANSNNISSQPERGRRGRLANGPSRGGRGGGRGGRGAFGRGRGGGHFGKKTIETWEPSTANHDDVSGVEDWDNEEYTGSLADSKVFTPSNAGSEPQTSESDELISQINNIAINSNSTQPALCNSSDPSLPQDNLRTPTYTAAQYLTHLATSHNNPSPSNISKSTCSSVFREFNHDIESASKFQSNSISRGTLRSSMLGLRSTGMTTSSPEPSQPRRNQRIAPPKIPLTAVEMPPEAVDTSGGMLDVQFGALEFGESTPENIVNNATTPPQPSPSPTRPEQLSAPTSVSEGLLLSETSYSPVRNAVSTSTSLPPMNDLSTKSVDATIPSSLYQEQNYQQTQFSTKVTQPSSVYSTGTYSTNSQVMTSNTISYNSGTSQNSYSSSTSGGFYGTNTIPQYQPYTNYTSQQPSQSLSLSLMNSTNSYQTGVGSQQYSNSNSSAGYGSSGLGSSSYSAQYQPSYSSQHNHSKSVLSSNTSTSKEYDNPAPTVNLSTLSQSNAINVTHSLLSATQTTSSSKQTSMSSGVPPFLGPYVMNQGGMPFFQPQMYSYDDIQMIQATAPRLPVPGYYNIDYQQPTTREGVQYNLSDNRFARPDNTSPVQASSISQQQSATQAHQPPLMNPTAIPPAYAYFYGGSMIPGNFQYGATLYHTAVPPAGASSGHGSAASSNVYGKGPGSYGTNYSGNYEQATSGEYKSSSSQSQKQSTSQSVNPSTTSDITMYSKSHSALSKISYDKQNYHCVTPPPFTLSSQNSGMGPGYPPSHLFIPSMTPHNTLLHPPLHQDSSSAVTGRSQVGNPQAKVGTKAYASSNYWAQN